MSGAGAPLWQAGAAELAALFRSGAADPVTALLAVLDRIAAVNPRVNAIVTLDAEGAMAAAEASRERWYAKRPLGPLDGVPLTVKDNLYAGGLRATWGSLLFADHVAPRDDLPIAALRAAGAVMLGKTNTPELALAGYTDNRLFGSTGNPWDLRCSPGGSSGGAVAGLVAGMGPLAVATDAGGSIRRPAAHAGVVGLKPGVGRVPRRHGFPPLAQDFQVIGPIGRSVEDVRIAFGVMAQGQGLLVETRPLRIGCFIDIPGAPVDPGVRAGFDNAIRVLRGRGHAVETVAPLWDPDRVGALFSGIAAVGVSRVVRGIADWEARTTPAIAAQARTGVATTAIDYLAMLDEVAAFRWRMADALAGFDVLATPASPARRWPKDQPGPTEIDGEPAGPRAAAIYSTAINLAGLPAIVLPSPINDGGLPVGLQLVGPMGGEERLMALASDFEAAAPWPPFVVL